MPKIMLKTPATKTESSNALSFSKPVEKTKVTVDTLTLQRILRKKRSQKYMEAMRSLDADMFIIKKKLMNLLML